MRIDVDALALAFRDVEFFIVCVAPESTPVFSRDQCDDLDIVASESFWAITSKAPQTGQGLVSCCADGHILFRGYESDLALHTYSDRGALELISDSAMLRNGVFAYMHLRENYDTIIRSDPFGVAPFYYRALNGAYLFSSHPALIHFPNDELDMVAWMSLLQSGGVFGDRSFYKDIHRVPAGVEMTISAGLLVQRTWFDFSALPPGVAEIDDAAFEIVEAAYASGMAKLLALKAPARTLPFSSGYDSRRFFGSMIKHDIAFDAVTCQTFHRKKGRDYDIDSFYAPKIALAFGVDCELVRASLPANYARDSARRMALIGTESFMHGWAVPFMTWLVARPMSIVFDGLAGDTFGNSGFEFDGLHINAASDTEILMNRTIDRHKFSHFSNLLPSWQQFSATYHAYLATFPANLNGAELAFLQSRTRRCISPWITMMHPAGQVVVFPYYDLGFVRATLTYNPADKYKWFFQKECLKRSYPEYFDFPGSRNLPADIAPISEEHSAMMEEQAENFAFSRFSVVAGSLKFLTWPNKLLLLFSVVCKPLRKIRSWLFVPLLLLVKTQQENRAFIERAD